MGLLPLERHETPPGVVGARADHLDDVLRVGELALLDLVVELLLVLFAGALLPFSVGLADGEHFTLIVGQAFAEGLAWRRVVDLHFIGGRSAWSRADDVDTAERTNEKLATFRRSAIRKDERKAYARAPF